MLNGKIVNINSTKYVVSSLDKTYNCILRGIFRKDKITPLVGDEVIFDEKTLTVESIKERKNYLTRPNIANVDIALILTSAKKPDLDLILLDKLLVHITKHNIKPIICFSKTDLLDSNELKEFNIIKDYYDRIGYQTILNTEIDLFNKLAKNKIIVCCGQTGAGKSTFINKIDNSLNLKTNEISKSLNRGVHTTRMVSLYKINDYYIADTPGFSLLELNNVDIKDIKKSFLEFDNYNCKYKDCNHFNTEGCSVIENVGKDILKSRYDNYLKFIKESYENSSKLFKK